MIKRGFILVSVIIVLMAFVVPKDFDYYYKKGVEAVEQGNNAAAIFYLDSAIALNINADTAFSLISYPYYILGKTNKAIDYANVAIEMNPKNAFAYYVRGLSKAAIDVSSDDLVKLVKKHRKDSVWMADNFFSRYYVTEQAGIFDYAEVIKDLDTSIMLNPKYAHAYASRAYYHNYLSQFEEAEADYNKSIELWPDNPYYYLNRGKFNEKYGSIGWARDDYTKSIELDSTLVESYYLRGKLYYHGFYDREYACKDLTKATLLGWYVENLEEYCTPTFLDSTSRYYGGKRWRHDFRSPACVCPDPRSMFDSEMDTIIEMELSPGIIQKVHDVKPRYKTTWEFDDGRIIEIDTKTKERWLKEKEEEEKKEQKKKEQEKIEKSNTVL